jgi:hypothetical protein
MQERDRQTTIGQRREMQAEDFRRLLARLHPDPVHASDAYEKLRRQLVSFFRKNQMPFQAEELADAALDEIAKKPDSYTIKNVSEFAIGVARFVRMESLRRYSTTNQIADRQDFPGRDKNPEHTILHGMDTDQKLRCFLKCMQGFKPEERWLILEYYPAESRDLEEHRRRLTIRLGIDANALTSRMNRLRAKLVKCCAGCYARGPRNP